MADRIDCERERVQEYLHSKGVNDLVYTILEQICVDRPENPHQYIVDFMLERFPGQTVAPAAAAELIDAEEPEEEEEDEAIPEPEVNAVVAVNGTSRRRRAVSAGSVTPSMLVKMYKRQVYEKSEEQRRSLHDVVKDNFLLQGLDTDQMNMLLDAMFVVTPQAGDTIIKQGNDGDNFYVIYDGECQVFIERDGVEKLVHTCARGDSFGELALMYNAPRAATVRAKTDCMLFAVDEGAFKFILMDSTLEKTFRYTGLLKRVPILSTLTDAEISTVSEGLTAADYEDGEVIIKQGDKDARNFYLVAEGEVACFLEAVGVPEQCIGKCKTGQYFGEIALLMNRPRACTVKARGRVKTLVMERKTFVRVMGPLQDLLKRNMSAYNSYMTM